LRYLFLLHVPRISKSTIRTEGQSVLRTTGRFQEKSAERSQTRVGRYNTAVSYGWLIGSMTGRSTKDADG
jgi:hypothetical protein